MKRLWILSCTMLLLLAGLASAQVTFDFSGGGARAEGMGKAYYGISDDATAVGWNPAGLIAQQRPVLSLSYASFRPRGSFKYELERFSQFGSFQNVTNVSFLSPVRIRAHQFILSAAYGQVLEDYSYTQIDYREDSLPNYPDGKTTFDARWQGSKTQHFNPYVLNFGFGTSLTKKLSMGIALNAYTGRAVLSSRDNVYFYGFRPIEKSLQSVTALFATNRLDTAKYSGVNFTFGFKYTLPKLTTGLVIKSGYSLNYMADWKYSDSVWYNNTRDYASTIYDDNHLVKYSIPWTIGVGGAYKLQENWIWSTDVEYRPYSGHKVRVRDSIEVGSSGGDGEWYSTIDPKWNNVFTLRTGTEYTLTSKSRFFPAVPLRFGIGIVPVPTPDFAADGSTTSTTLYNVTAGTGIHWSQIYLDLSYVFGIHDNLTYWSTVLELGGGNYQVVSVGGEEKTRSHRLNLTFTGYF